MDLFRPARARAGTAVFLAVLQLSVTALGDPAQVAGPTVHAPPANPPTGLRDAGDSVSRPELALSAAGNYSIGDPTDEEQLYVEFINRARANPPAEALRMVNSQDPDIQSAYKFFGVDLNKVVSDFQSIAAAPPLSIQPSLTTAARTHSLDMFQNEFQGHNGTDGKDLGARITATGYPWQTYGENVFSYAENVWHGHVGFDVDWGNGPGGVQSPPGHRNTIHNAAYREIGVGVILGTKGSVGPQLVTQEFGSARNAKPFVTGVVYYDLNANQFYDPGEGIGGVTVSVSGTATKGITARSGGYSVPVSINGAFNVTFDIPGLAPVQKSVTIAGLANSKIDHAPTYSAPVLGGSSVAFVGQDNRYAFSPVGGATAYQWRTFQRLPWTDPEGAETGLGRFKAATTAGYDPISSTTRQAGTRSFHLVMPKGENQYLTTALPIRLGTAGLLSFWSRLGWAAPTQVARAQVSADAGASWTDVWTRTGTGNQGERNFSRQTASLAAFAGQTVQLRFGYTFASGSYFNQIDDTIGWCIDDISVADAEELTEEKIDTAPSGETFDFAPTVEGGFILQVRALIGDRQLPWGPAFSGTAEARTTLPVVVHLDSFVRSAANRWDIAFTVQLGTPTALEVQVAPEPDGPWTTDATTSVSSTGDIGKYAATVSTAVGATRRFYRISAK